MPEDGAESPLHGALFARGGKSHDLRFENKGIDDGFGEWNAG